jgi:N-acetylneuraminate synthase
MFYVFEMANNHQGSIEHAKRIIDEFSKLSKKYKLSAAIKLQFRNLDTFIHKDFKNSDLKYVKRFNDTRLSSIQFKEIIQYIQASNLTTMATPFDNESLKLIHDLDVSIVKVASCSIDDWPLLEEICKINKRIIISTAGASIQLLRKVYRLFKINERDFAFMHCVGEYPTPQENANLDRISLLRNEFPDIEIGFSTHESPSDESLAPFAVALGCSILEKHVGIPTDVIELNKYSCTVEDFEKVIKKIKTIRKSMVGTSSKQQDSLKKLKRGIYFKNMLECGQKITLDNLYFAMPCQENQVDVSNIDKILGKKSIQVHDNDSIVPLIYCNLDNIEIKQEIKKRALQVLERANIHCTKNDKVEISAHYGLNNFFKTGALIINKINRKFCKKLIILFENQKHPTHYHIKKEEAFELLDGDCILILNDKEINLELGKPVLITKGTKHSFRSKNGCVIEEVSTTHYKNDSVYEDPEIFKLKISERKYNVKLLN